MRIDEQVGIETSPQGAPVRFTWRNVAYGVVSNPEVWVARNPWWASSRRLPAGASAILVEVRAWRVEAVPLTDGAGRIKGVFDLGFVPGVGWVLLGTVDDQVDQLLFA